MPRARREVLLQEMHKDYTGGHLEIKRTLCQLGQVVYCVGLCKDVQDWCCTCKVCAAKKDPTRKMRAPLQLYQASAPMQRVAVDISSPFPHTQRSTPCGSDISSGFMRPCSYQETGSGYTIHAKSEVCPLS